MNNREPEISIIVPVFNAEKTLARCVESVISQTYPYWELLLIDDGSTDNSLSECNNAALNDKRIRVLSQDHRGVSFARNLALENVRGNYICFVDADDSVEPDYLESLFQYHNYDMVLCGYFVDTFSIEGQQVKKEIHIPTTLNCSSLSDKTILLPLFMSGMIHINCNKLLNTSIIQSYGVRYQEFPVNEDYIFMIDYLSHCKSIVTVEKPLYHWIRIIGGKSGVDSMPDNLLDIYNLAHQKTRNFFVNNNEYADVTQYYSYFYLVQKYFKAYKDGHLPFGNLSRWLSDFHRNDLVKASFKAYQPKSKGECLMHSLLKYGWFNIYIFVNEVLTLWRK